MDKHRDLRSWEEQLVAQIVMVPFVMVMFDKLAVRIIITCWSSAT